MGLVEGSLGVFLFILIGPHRSRELYVTSPGSVKLAWMFTLALMGCLAGLIGAALGARRRQDRVEP